MSTVISRRSFLKCTGASAAALGAASLLGGCKSNGSDTVVEVKVGDTVRNWNGLGVQLTSVFHLTQDPVQPAGYEYLGVRVTAVNRSKTESYAIGAQGIDAINEAYPVPPLRTWTQTFRLWLLLPRILSPSVMVSLLPAAPISRCTTPIPRAFPMWRACPRRAALTLC